MSSEIDEAKTFGTHKPVRIAIPPLASATQFLRRETLSTIQFNQTQRQFRSKLHALVREYDKDSEKASTRRMAFRKLKKNSRAVFNTYYNRAYSVGAGTSLGAIKRTLPSASQDWLAKSAASELEYWDNFMTQLHTGDLKQSVDTRIGYYVNSLEAVYHAGKVATLPDMIIMWVVDRVKENCSGCLLLQRSGPYTKEGLPTTPKAGDTQCKFNCYCRLEYREPSSKREYQILAGRGAAVKRSIIAALRRTG